MMVQRRLLDFRLCARNLLKADAILDHNFTFEQLCQVSHLTAQDGSAALAFL
jgi:hypothetical protein